jgi:hypothetical protein
MIRPQGACEVGTGEIGVGEVCAGKVRTGEVREAEVRVGFWSRAPSEAAVGIFGDDLLELPELVEACRAQDWRIIHFSEADQREWDDFESTFRAGKQEWLLAHGDDPRAAEVREWLDARERQYAGVYRGLLGLAYLVVAR